MNRKQSRRVCRSVRALFSVLLCGAIRSSVMAEQAESVMPESVETEAESTSTITTPSSSTGSVLSRIMGIIWSEPPAGTSVKNRRVSDPMK